jgi:hypothetical protein
MDSALRPMSTGQVLDRTFHLYRNNFLLFAGISALPPAVVLLAQAASSVLSFIPAPQVDNVTAETLLVLGVIVMVVAYLLALSLATGATVYAVSRTHLGHSVRISESYKVIRPLLGRIVRIVVSVAIRFTGAFVVAVVVGFVPITLIRLLSISADPTTVRIIAWGGGLLTVVAVIVCVLWAIRLYCSYQLAVPACVLELRGAVDCLKRSRFLSKGKGVQRILLVLFLTAILTYVLSLALSLPVLVLAMFTNLDQASGLAVPAAIWQAIAGFAAGTIAGPIVTIALALLYYDERVRKEAFDLQLLMEAVGEQTQMQAVSAAPPA